MLKTMKLVWIAALLSCACASHARELAWDLTDLSFEDGAVATGRFIFNTRLNEVTRFNITTTSGTSILTPFHYTANTATILGQANVPGGSGFPETFLQLRSNPGENPSGDRELFLAFSGPLELGGVVTILAEGTLGRTSFETEILGERVLQRLVLGGTAVDPPLPEPSEIAFLGVGLALMAWVIARRKNRGHLRKVTAWLNVRPRLGFGFAA